MGRQRVNRRRAVLVTVVAALACWPAAPAQTSKKVQKSAQSRPSRHFNQLAPLHGVISVDWQASGTRTTTDASGTMTASYDGHLSLRVSVDGTAGEKNGYYWQRGDVQLDFRERLQTVMTPKQGPEFTIDETVELTGPAEPLGVPGDGKATSFLSGQLHPDGKEALLGLEVRARIRSTTRMSAPIGTSEAKESSFVFRLSSGHEEPGRGQFHAPAVKQGSDISLDGHLSEATIGRWGTAYGYFMASGPARELVSRIAQGEQMFRAAPWEGTISISWHLTTQDFELVVDPEDYASWIPEGGKDEKTVGNRLTVHARLQTGAGKPSDQKAKQFIFELKDTSEQPGVCMNLPPREMERPGVPKRPPDPDLGFDRQRNPKLEIKDPRAQIAWTKPGEKGIGEATAVIASYDWGGYSLLKVTAQMPDGRKVEGHLAGHPGVVDILLPKRKEESLIADAWKEKRGVEDQKDNDDNEEDPEGDGHKGDGLTLYEEYRGFWENGRHIYGDPKKKDYFIADLVPTQRAKDGIALFQGLSGLAVHHRFIRKDFSEDRVINFNRDAATPHQVDQHGVVMVYLKKKVGGAYADGGPGTPAKIREVVITDDYDPGPDGWDRYKSGEGETLVDHYSTTVAHELFHASNVPHHGNGDIGNVRWSEGEENGEGVVLENALSEKGDSIGTSKVVWVYNEDGTAESPLWMSLPEDVYVGSWGKQHSGDEECVMHYCVADAYVSLNNSQVRYRTEEHRGIGLCETSDGTGVNGPGHKPQPRYGPANFGNCRHRICVNDKRH